VERGAGSIVLSPRLLPRGFRLPVALVAVILGYAAFAATAGATTPGTGTTGPSGPTGPTGTSGVVSNPTSDSNPNPAPEQTATPAGTEGSSGIDPSVDTSAGAPASDPNASGSTGPNGDATAGTTTQEDPNQPNQTANNQAAENTPAPETNDPSPAQKTIDSASPQGDASQPAVDNTPAPVAAPDSTPQPIWLPDNSDGITHRRYTPGDPSMVAIHVPAGTKLIPVSLAWTVDCRFSALCGTAVLARAPSEAEVAFFGQCPPRTSQPTRETDSHSAAAAGSRRSGPPPALPRLPGPDHQPQGPSFLGALAAVFSASGDFRGAALLGLIAILLVLTPFEGKRPVALVSRRRRPLLLAFLLERPG
jgi:hypothetical protein